MDVDAWTRAYAEDHARRAGMSVRDWIEQFVAQKTDQPERASRDDEADQAGGVSDDDGLTVVESEMIEAAEEPDWAARASAAFAAVEAQTIEEAPALQVETIAVAPAPDLPSDDRIERVLDELSAQVDTVRAQMSARLREDSTRRLDGIERALRGMREQIQAVEQGAGMGGEYVSEAPAIMQGEVATAPSQYFAAAAAGARNVEAARMVEIMESGFERLEASSARQMAGLRADIEHLFDGLAARINSLEQRATPPVAEIDDQSTPLAAEADTQPALAAAELETQLPPPLAEASERHAEPTELDSDLFDDFPEPSSPTLRELLNVAPVAAVNSAQSEAPAPFTHENADFEVQASADDNLVGSDDEWAAAGSAPMAWPDVSGATTEPEFVADAWGTPTEPLPLTIRARSQSQDAAPGAAKTSIFSLFGRGQSRLRKSA